MAEMRVGQTMAMTLTEVVGGPAMYVPSDVTVHWTLTPTDIGSIGVSSNRLTAVLAAFKKGIARVSVSVILADGTPLIAAALSVFITDTSAEFYIATNAPTP